MEQGKIVQLRKKHGLTDIMKSKNGEKLRPILFSTKTKDPREEGVSQGEYKGKTLLNTKEFLTPTWDMLKKRWAFAGNNQDLVRLVKEMGLKYQPGHERAGQTIKPFPTEGPDAAQEISRLTDFHDPVFRNPELYKKVFMTNGKVDFNTNDAMEEFLLLGYKDNSFTHDKSSDKIVSPYIAAGTKYELVSPRKETQVKRKDADKEVKAIQLLASMSANEPKMRSIATIMGLPHYSNTTDTNGLFLLLKDTAAQNSAKSSKYGMSFQDRFIELAEMTDSDINVQGKIIEAKNRAFIRKKTDHYLFNGERIEVKTEAQLISYFLDGEHQDKFLELEELLDSRK